MPGYAWAWTAQALSHQLSSYAHYPYLGYLLVVLLVPMLTLTRAGRRVSSPSV